MFCPEDENEVVQKERKWWRIASTGLQEKKETGPIAKERAFEWPLVGGKQTRECEGCLDNVTRAVPAPVQMRGGPRQPQSCRMVAWKEGHPI